MKHAQEHFSPLRRLRSNLMLQLLFALSAITVTSAVANTADETFAAALTELRERREKSGPLIKSADLFDMNETFFGRINLAELGPRHIAQILRFNVFAQNSRGPELAKQIVQRMDPIASQPDADGALAAIICAKLAGPADLDGKERQAWRTRVLHHPALVQLLQSEYGDLALDTATSAGGDEKDHQRLHSLSAALDATKSTAPVSAVMYYWNRRVEKLPPGEQRELIRQRLLKFLTTALSQVTAESGTPEKRTQIETALTHLNGAAARGELIGRPAPEIHFLWSSHDEITTLSDLRGKVVVLDFWATWCGPCVESFPELARFAERYQGFDVAIVGVTSIQGMVVGLNGKMSIDCRNDPEKEIRLMGDYIKERAITWPVVVSRENAINPDYGCKGLPTVVVIAPDGTVRYTASGFSKAKVMAQVDALLTESKRAVPAHVNQVSSSP